MRQVTFDVERFPFRIAECGRIQPIVNTTPLRQILVADILRQRTVVGDASAGDSCRFVRRDLPLVPYRVAAPASLCCSSGALPS